MQDQDNDDLASATLDTSISPSWVQNGWMYNQNPDIWSSWPEYEWFLGGLGFTYWNNRWGHHAFRTSKINNRFSARNPKKYSDFRIKNVSSTYHAHSNNSDKPNIHPTRTPTKSQHISPSVSSAHRSPHVASHH